ncbi:Basic-leucine zipper (bZIP) transcription factor family [Zostera marina]|uniref:Basic-leucine zipper (BZIP) transcription factor family n=1 Tax=Zostera marina TaxID=29655 RepID=A0A0K9PN78_ZOSMR|nr:Basic-leucine zipper (bZIP) transcription factor family [Zostera marina]
MEDGGDDLSTQFLLSNSEIEELLRSTCTHTHTCNSSSRDDNTTGHTHTCYHTHTRVIKPAEEEDEEEQEEEEEGRSRKHRKTLGNKEAVRKYREKKKAYTDNLEDEVKELRKTNMWLKKKLQGQVVLQAEVLRLRSLLDHFRGEIEGELGRYPFVKSQYNDPLLMINGLEKNQCLPAMASCEMDENCNLVPFNYHVTRG